MRIIITGGAGFLGVNLCERLLREGNDVVCLDDLSSGNPLHLSFLSSLSSSPSDNPNSPPCGLFEFHKIDVCNDKDVRNAVGEKEDKKVDLVFHLACPASPPFYQRQPLQTLTTCFQGTFNILQLAERHKAAVMVASTSEVYGNPTEHPQKESYFGHVNPFGPRSCYDEGKRVAEALCYSFMKEGRAEVKVVRIFNVYGPGMRSDDGRVVSNFICQALQNLPLTIYGDGSQTRSFCFVDDTIDAFLRVMKVEGNVGPINIGRPCETLISELADSILQLIPESTSKVEIREAVEDDPSKRLPDITLARSLLGWEPKTDLTTGLELTIRHFRSLIQPS